MGGTPAEVVARQLTEQTPTLRDRRPEVPAQVDSLVRRMTAKRADDRPPSYPDLLRLLASPIFAGDESGTATLARTAAPVAALRRRGPCFFVTAAALLLATLLGAFFFLRGQARQGSFAVAVVPLHAPDAESDKEGRVLATLIENELRRRLPEDDVDVFGIDDVGKSVRTARGAQAVATRLDADVVVWGEALALGGAVAFGSRITRRDGTALPEAESSPWRQASLTKRP